MNGVIFFFLAGESLPPNLSPHAENVGSAFQRILDDLNPNPAYVLGRRWDFVAWNDAADAIFVISEVSPPHDFNLIWRFFTDSVWKMRTPNWEQKARRIIAEFHTATARYVEDSSFAELIEDLKRVSPEFDRLWLQHETPALSKDLKKCSILIWGTWSLIILPCKSPMILI
jgi:hypothetical protein